jgi:hypothetical protein
LQARIAGDQQYQNNPLVASFDVPVIIGGVVAKFAQIIVILTLVGLIIFIIAIFLGFNKRAKRTSTSE